MSEARDKFFEMLAHSIEAIGYEFKKSKKIFIKTDGTLEFIIDFNWDGRGGVTYLNNVNASVEITYTKKAIKKLLNRNFAATVYQNGNSCHFNNTIPPMYSKALLELGNNMDFKKMAAMPFDEKYPQEKIKAMADKVESIIVNDLVPFHKEFDNEKIILQFKINWLLDKLNQIDTHNIMSELLLIKIVCKKLKQDEPQFIKDIRIFANDTIDDLWNMQDYEYDKMKDRFNDLKL